MRHIGRTFALVISLVAAGCTTHGPLEDRVINVEPSGAAALRTQDGINGLVSKAGQSYVTLVVSESARRDRTALDFVTDPLTAGSGFVVDPAGYVVTAGHVAVKQGNMVNLRGPHGEIYRGKVVDVKPDHDVALIKADGLNAPAVMPVSDPCLRRGESVFSLGKPHAHGDTARLGQVEAMSFGRAVTYQSYGYPDAMVLRMGTQKGESGGPVFNANGQLAGMIVSTLSDGNGQPLNLAHALPSTSIAQFVCSEIQCSAGWAALSAKSTQSCPRG